MKKDPKFYHVPGWFEYVSALGASLLVDATGKLFRDYKPNGPLKDADDMEDDSYQNDIDSEIEQHSGQNNVDNPETNRKDADAKGGASAKPSQGQALLSLEYLVSNLSIFDVTLPHDAIYALLAIAKDTTPAADDHTGFYRLVGKTQQTLELYVQRKRYIVDYEKPFADVCKEFVHFCFMSSKDRTRALDIVCRPWAPEEQSRASKKNTPKPGPSASQVGITVKSRHNPAKNGRSRYCDGILAQD